MMFNNIRHLKYVSTVAKCGSLIKAAQELLVSESAISAAIKACEEELGYSIFIRRPAKPLVLTRTGAEFVRGAQYFVEQAEAFYEQSVGYGVQLKGTIRLGCFSAISSAILPPILQHCQTNLPNLTVQISEYDLPEMLTRLRNGEVEIAITYDLHYDSEITFEPLFSVTPHIGLSATHHLADKQALWLTEISEEPLILIDYPVTKQNILKLFVDRGITPRPIYYPKSIDTLHAFVAQNLGYSIFFMKPDFAGYRGATLKRIAIKDDVPSHNVVIAHSKNVQVSAKVAAIAAVCAEVFGNRNAIKRSRYWSPN
jgi:DNA-binding transcriptional LysR family regulator